MSGFNLSALAVRERAVTLFLIIAVSLAGAFAFLKLGRAETLLTMTYTAIRSERVEVSCNDFGSVGYESHSPA